MVAWRRGDRIKDRANAPLISNATVNRSATKVLQRLFTFFKAEGATIRARTELGAISAARAGRAGARAAGRGSRRRSMTRCATTTRPLHSCAPADCDKANASRRGGSEVNFGSRPQIVRTGKGGKRVTFPITSRCGNSCSVAGAPRVRVHLCRRTDGTATGRVQGQRYPLTYHRGQVHGSGCEPRRG